jgi:hypothetical protein
MKEEGAAWPGFMATSQAPVVVADDEVAWPAELFDADIVLGAVSDIGLNNSKPPLPPSGPDHVAWPDDLF